MKKKFFILMLMLFISSCSSVSEKEQAKIKQQLEKEANLERKKDKAFDDLERSADKVRKQNSY